MYKHILVPVDGSKLALSALDTAGKLAIALGARITAVHVVPDRPATMTEDGYALELGSPARWRDTMRKHALGIQTAVERRVAGKGFIPAFESVTSGETYTGILAAACKLKCDLIVMSSHGRRGVSALLLGSETNKVLAHSSIPVLVCRKGRGSGRRD